MLLKDLLGRSARARDLKLTRCFVSTDQRGEREVELAAAQYFAESFAQAALAVADRKAEADKLVSAAEVEQARPPDSSCQQLVARLEAQGDQVTKF